MGVGIRCFQCKVKLQGKKTGREHAQATGHAWQPGYYCTDCEQTFSSNKLCKQHIKGAGVHSKAKSKSVPPKTSTVVTRGTSSSSASDRPALTPSKPALLATGLVAPLGPNTPSSGTSVIASKAENESSPLRCTMCPMTFSSNESLEQHLEREFTCTKCSLHFYESEKLQDHYRTSSAHPRCRECGQGFSTLSEWAMHRARCPPPVPSTAESVQSSSAPRSVSDEFSIVSTSAAEELDAVSHDGTAIEPSKASSLVPRTRSPSPDPVATVADAKGDSLSDGVSASEDTPETFVTAETFAAEKPDPDPKVHALQDIPAPSKADKRKDNALSSNKVATPKPATVALREGGPKKAAANPLSFRCRSCLADPCVKPVATLCGHIFCHGCIVRELAAKMCCPVCQRPFMVRLQVDS